MGESTLAMRPTVNCFGWVMANPRQARHIVLVACVMGALSALAAQSFAYLTRPSNPVLAPGDALRISKVDGGGTLLTLHYRSARSTYCTRQSGDLVITNDAEWDGRPMSGYYTLSFGQNGPGMYYGTSDEYVLWRYIPPGIPVKKWQYILRVRHECQPWGLIHWNYTSEPQEVVIP